MKSNYSCSLISGLISGLTATLPMTVAMIALHRLLPRRERYPLPPALITERLSKRAGLADRMNKEARLGATMAAHFSFGAAAGAAYPVLTGSIPAHPLARGIGYGLFVWTGSYLGLLPGLRILTPATMHPPRRNVLMITAHVVWGATLGLLENRMNRTKRDEEHSYSEPEPTVQDSIQDKSDGILTITDPTASADVQVPAPAESLSTKLLMALFLSFFFIGCGDPDRPENPPLVDQNEVRPEQITRPVPPQTNTTNNSR